MNRIIDFTIECKENEEVRLLQLTDTQVIDSSQLRYEDRLRPDEKSAWARDRIDGNCYNHIRSIVTQTKPHFIFITGDIVYGQFDDSGEIFADFISFMDSLRTPWGLTFGNHDNESKIGIQKQCEMLEASEFCLFKPGNVSGNSNYTIGFTSGNKLRRIMYFLDTHGCLRKSGILPDQLEWMDKTALLAEENYGAVPKGFLSLHIPPFIFRKAEREKGYVGEKVNYILGVDKKPLDNDFGFSLENEGDGKYIATDAHFEDVLNKCRIDGIFAGHFHKHATSILYNGIQLVLGLKTGQYDYHVPGQTGGTLITLDSSLESFKVSYVPAMVTMSPVPSKAPSYQNIFTD